MATRFAASGADVAIVARTGEPLKEGVAAIRKSSQSRVIGVQADVSEAADIQRAFDEVMKASSSTMPAPDQALNGRPNVRRGSDQLIHTWRE